MSTFVEEWSAPACFDAGACAPPSPCSLRGMDDEGGGYRKEQTSVNVVLCGPYVKVSALPRAVGMPTLHW